MKGFVADMTAFPKTLVLHICTVYSKQLQKLHLILINPWVCFLHMFRWPSSQGRFKVYACVIMSDSAHQSVIWWNESAQALCCHNMQKWKSHQLNAFFFYVLQLKTFSWQCSFMSLPNGSFNVESAWLSIVMWTFQLWLINHKFTFTELIMLLQWARRKMFIYIYIYSA